MNTINMTATEVRQNIAKAFALVKEGNRVAITRHGKVIAQLESAFDVMVAEEDQPLPTTLTLEEAINSVVGSDV